MKPGGAGVAVSLLCKKGANVLDAVADTADHVANLRALNVTPHVTQNDSITATGKRRPERHRWTYHAAPRRRLVAIVSGNDRMHLRLGQAARHDAQDQTSRLSPRGHRLPAKSDRLQSDPHSHSAGGIGSASAHNNTPRPLRTRG
jgi:hypothetical protein